MNGYFINKMQKRLEQKKDEKNLRRPLTCLRFFFFKEPETYSRIERNMAAHSKLDPNKGAESYKNMEIYPNDVIFPLNSCRYYGKFGNRIKNANLLLQYGQERVRAVG